MSQPSRIAIGAAYGLGARGVERAYERGVRTFLWGAIRNARFAEGLSEIARRDRGSIEIAIQSYTRQPRWLAVSVALAARKLDVDLIDTLCLADWDTPPPSALVDAAEELRDRGKIKRVIVSCHQRKSFVEMRRFDGWMVRYNAAHRAAETEVFSIEQRPRVIAYTSTRWGTLLDPAYAPEGARPLTATECYRFVLSHPAVDLCLAGPANEHELDAALDAHDLGPLDDEHLALARLVGDNAKAHGQARPPPGPRDLARAIPSMVRDAFRHGITENLFSRFNR